jgi:hypothetical protein
MDDSGNMFNYECVIIKTGDGQLKTFFSKGKGLPDAPTVTEVLYCLASNAAGYENAQSFEDWCNEYGYSTDSRKAERTWLAVVDGAKKLKTLLGPAYEELLWETERE